MRRRRRLRRRRRRVTPKFFIILILFILILLLAIWGISALLQKDGDAEGKPGLIESIFGENTPEPTPTNVPALTPDPTPTAVPIPSPRQALRQPISAFKARCSWMVPPLQIIGPLWT